MSLGADFKQTLERRADIEKCSFQPCLLCPSHRAVPIKSLNGCPLFLRKVFQCNSIESTNMFLQKTINEAFFDVLKNLSGNRVPPFLSYKKQIKVKR